MKLSEIKPNDRNPRYIREPKFDKLVESLRAFPAMMELRPIIVDESNIILGGNMRYRAIKTLGYNEIPESWVKRASELTEDEKKQFIIKDNVGFGEWDWDMIANEWDSDLLNEWGLDLPDFEAMADYSNKNQEIDIDDLDGTMTIKLNFSETDYWHVKQQLSEIAATPEQAVWKLLGNE